jgi:hypothetical protein
MQSAAAWVAAGKAKVAAPPATAVRPAVEGAGQAAALGWAVARSPAGNPLLVVGHSRAVSSLQAAPSQAVDQPPAAVPQRPAHQAATVGL